MRSVSNVWASVLLFVLAGSNSSPAQVNGPRPSAARSQDQPARRPRPSSPQEIDLLAAGYSTQNKILLTINNNRSAETPVSVTAYTLDGQSHSLANLVLVSRESLLMDIAPMLITSGLSKERIGYLKLNYDGAVMEVGAQLTLYRTQASSGFDSPRSLVVDYKTNRRSATFLVPRGGTATLTLTNISPSSINGVVNCDRSSEPFRLAPNATHVTEVSPIEPFQQNDHKATGCDITFDGSSSALRAFGVITRESYSAPVRFYDPDTATSPNLTATGVRTSQGAMAVVHNTTSSVVSFVPVLRDSSLAPTAERRLRPVILPPHESKAFELGDTLSDLASQGHSLATLTIETPSQNGAIIGAVDQVDDAGVVEDIPLRTSNPPAFDRGSYPLRWTEDYTNQVTITNTSDHALGYRASITAGDAVYVLPKVTLDPHATKVYDVDALRRDGTPDVNGVKLPPSAPYGKFLWAELSNGRDTGLLGRQSLASHLNQRRSSFSCGETCDWSYDTQPVFYLPSVLIYGASQSVPIYDRYESISWPATYYPIPFSYVSYSITSDGDSPVISIGADANNPNAFIETAIGVGRGILYFDVREDDFVLRQGYPDCWEDGYDYWDYQFTDIQPAVTISGPSVVPISATGGTPNTIQLTATGAPTGGTYSWSSSDSSVTLSNSTTATVTVSGTSAVTATLTVTYTVNGLSNSATQQVTVVGCPTGISIANTTPKALPDADDPTFLTGVGILALMTVTPTTNVYTGAVIQEQITPVSNSCPANIYADSTFPTISLSANSTFTVGSSAHWEQTDYPVVANSFYDSHRQLSHVDILGSTNGATCNAVATQVYTCNGTTIGTFTLTNTYTHGTLSGNAVTNVTTTKQ